VLRCHAGRICRSNRVLRELNATPGETGRWRGCYCRARPSAGGHRRTSPTPARMLPLLLLLLLTQLGALARVGEALAAADQRNPVTNPLRGLNPLAKPHFSYPPDIHLLNDPTSEELLLDFIRVTGSLTPPSANDQLVVRRTVQLCVLYPPASAERRLHAHARRH
jgi:hypothetical protein